MSWSLNPLAAAGVSREMPRLLAALLLAAIPASAQPAAPVAEIDRLMTTLHERGQCDGAVLVSVGDTVVYRRAFGRDDYGAIVTGDGGIYSTVDDLYAWDRALHTGRLVRQATLAEAFTPGAVRDGTTTYGFGWNVTGEGRERHVWHTGNTAGFRSLAEAYAQARNRTAAVASYREALRLDSTNVHAATMLRRLGSAP